MSNNILCCTMFSPSHEELAEVSVPNLQEYCTIHGYDMRIIYIENDKWEYKKHEAFREYFKEGYDLIWYKDVDSVITNLKIPITNFIDDKHDFFITRDFTELNGGSVIIKNTVPGIFLNDMILINADFLKNTSIQNEQNVYNSIYGYCKNIIKELPHPSINSYHYNLYPECKEYVGREDLGDWKDGNFLLHVPALQMEQRIKILKSAKITL